MTSKKITTYTNPHFTTLPQQDATYRANSNTWPTLGAIASAVGKGLTAYLALTAQATGAFARPLAGLPQPGDHVALGGRRLLQDPALFTSLGGVYASTEIVQPLGTGPAPVLDQVLWPEQIENNPHIAAGAPSHGDKSSGLSAGLSQPTGGKTTAIDEVNFCTPKPAALRPSKNITDMTEPEVRQFSAAMLTLISRRLVVAHYDIDHSDPFDFWEGHNRYLQCVENRLADEGVTLPVWSPDTRIPHWLQVVKRSPERCDTEGPACSGGWYAMGLHEVDPQIPLPRRLQLPELCEAKTLSQLLAAAGSYHGRTHSTVGGMGSFATLDSPAAPLFMAWHNGLNKMYLAWKEQCVEAQTPAPAPQRAPATSPPAALAGPCLARASLGSLWEQDGKRLGALNLQVRNQGSRALPSPWSFTVRGDYADVKSPWSFAVIGVTNGTVSGTARDEWQTLLPSGANSLDAGFIAQGTSTRSNLLPSSVAVAGEECTLQLT